MPTTTVNSLTVVHRQSGGTAIAFPDVCKTPSPAGGTPVPIPYPNIASSQNTADGSSTVKVDGNPIMLRGSNFSTSTGDEAGTALGILSNKIKGKAIPLTYSFDVMVDGDFVFRQLDLMLQNVSPPPNTPPGVLVQPPLLVPFPWFDPPKWSVRWSKRELKCGDEVYIAWVTRTGLYPKNQVKLDIFAFGGGAYEKSGYPLLITVPEEAKQPGSKLRRSVPKMTPVLQPDGTYTYTQGTGTWGWDYGFDLEIKNGVFKVTARIKLVAKGGATFGDTEKKAWKQEIETIWTRRWREHRKACLRGTKCNCWGGCCLFPVEVECLFVDSGEFAEVEVWNGNPDTHGHTSGRHNKWWNSGTWFMERCGHEGNQLGVRAHEVGHTLGLYDEYRTGAIYVPTDSSGNATGQPPNPDVPGSLMGPSL